MSPSFHECRNWERGHTVSFLGYINWIFDTVYLLCRAGVTESLSHGLESLIEEQNQFVGILGVLIIVCILFLWAKAG